MKHGPIVALCQCGRQVRLAFVGVLEKRFEKRPFEEMVLDETYDLIHAAMDDHGSTPFGHRWLNWTNGWTEAKVRKALSEGEPK